MVERDPVRPSMSTAHVRSRRPSGARRHQEEEDNRGRSSTRKGRADHRSRPWPGPVARDPAGGGGRGHDRDRRRRPIDGVAPSSTRWTPEDLAETVRQSRGTRPAVVATQADVRDIEGLHRRDGRRGRAAGPARRGDRRRRVFTFGTETPQGARQSWQDLIDSDLTGAGLHRQGRGAAHLLEASTGSSVTVVGSLAGFKGLADVAALHDHRARRWAVIRAPRPYRCIRSSRGGEASAAWTTVTRT